MDFVTAVKHCFSHYADFKGRAQRSQYWFFILFYFIAAIILLTLEAALLGSAMLYYLFILGMFIPMLSVGVRRLHDLNKSGWWLLIGIIPLINLIGSFVLLFWFVGRGTEGPNEYGPDPLGGVPSGPPEAA